MDGYKLIIKKSVFKDVQDIPKEDLRKIDERIKTLAEDPRPRDYQKFSIKEHYRIRSGDYRIVYTIDDIERIVRVPKIGHRSEVYR